MNAIARYWQTKAHSAIESGYSSAIQNYTAQKNNFLQELNIEAELAGEEFIEQINQEIQLELSSELDTTFNEAFSAVKDYFEKYIVSLISSGTSSYQELESKFQKLIRKSNEGKVDPKNLYTNLKSSLETFLVTSNHTRETIMKYVSAQTGLRTENTDIQNNLFGYARRLLLQYMQSQKLNYSIQHYKTALKGYYKEELLVPAFQKVLSQYSNKIVTQTGSLTSSKGVQIKYDLFIGNSEMPQEFTQLSTFINKLEAMAGTVEGNSQINGAFQGGGIQSKSWVLPWSTSSVGGNRNYLSFGHNAALMPDEYNAHFWHAGVYNVMSNLTSAIGPLNFLFSTGDQVYWTADLLTELKERQYVLAFYYNKKEEKIISSDISAQLHTD